MGLGINAANDPDFKEYQLSQQTGWEFIEPISDDAKIAELKTEFGRWIIANGLRELVETFALFLDQVNHVCLLMATKTGMMPAAQAKKKANQFAHGGIEAKLEFLKRDFGIDIVHGERLASIAQARNCLTHRSGTVSPRDCPPDSQLLTVGWIGLDIYAQTPAGETISLFPLPSGLVLECGTKIMARPAERSRTFSLGSRVVLSARDLAEICQFVLTTTDQVLGATEQFARKQGIPVSTPKPPEPKTPDAKPEDDH